MSPTRLFVLLLFLSGCSGLPELTDEDVKVLNAWPTCDYESLGRVEGRHGHQGFLDGARHSARGSEKVALSRLRLAAQERGGDAVIVVRKEIKQYPTGEGSIQARPARLVRFIGIAIKQCQSQPR